MIQQWDNSNFIYYIVYSDNIRTILYFVPLQMDFIPETNWDRDLNAPGAQGSRGTCSEHGSAGPSRSDFAKSLGLGDTTWLFCSNEKGRWLRNKQEKGDILTSWLGVFFLCVLSHLTYPGTKMTSGSVFGWDATEAIPLSALAGKQNLFGKRRLKNNF